MLKNFLLKFYSGLPIIRELTKVRANIHEISQKIIHFESMRFFDSYIRTRLGYQDPLRLIRHNFQVCSQNGEDGIIHEIFERIGTVSKIFVEVGVGNGLENNTIFLLSQNWQGFWIDGNPTFVKKLAEKGMLTDGSLQYRVSFVTKENIESLFTELNVPTEFDLLSLDIDQNTYYIWEASMDYRPRVVVIEYNGSIPPEIDWKVNYDPDRTWDGTINFGASLKAYEQLGKKLGYSLVGCDFTGNNAFFVRDDLVEDKFARPFTSENHFEPARIDLVCKRGLPASILDKSIYERRQS